jgi:flagellin
MSKSLERLSSGLKINKASDDPAGLVISENMRAQISGLNQAIENSELATAMVQTAEGALTEIHSLLNSMRELAIHAANSGVASDADRAADQAEIENALATIQRISEYTQFGTKSLLDGSNGLTGAVIEGAVEYLAAGAQTASGYYSMNVSTRAEKAIVQTANSGLIAGITADESLVLTNNITGATATIYLEAGDNAQTIADKINAYTDTLGVEVATDGTDLTVSSTIYGSDANFTIYSDNEATDGSQSGFSAAGDTGNGIDVAGTFVYDGVAYQVEGVGAVMHGRSGTPAEGLQVFYNGATGSDIGRVLISNQSMTFQVGPNADQTVSVAVANIASRELGRGLDAAFDGSNQFRNLSEISVLDTSMANDTLSVIDKAIAEISAIRGDLGAFQGNTLESGLNSLRVAQENLVAAESIIRDTDMAAEVASFTRSQIMLQSATAMLSHANSTPSIVLQLLG